MKPYTTTIENILPGMIVRFTSSDPGWDHDKTYTFTVKYTRLPVDQEEGQLIGEGCGFAVTAASEITVLHDPTQSGQGVQVSVEGLSDDVIASMARRSAEQVRAYYKGKPPQQYNTGGLDLLRDSYGQ